MFSMKMFFFSFFLKVSSAVDVISTSVVKTDCNPGPSCPKHH